MQARTPPAQARILLAIAFGLSIGFLGCSRSAPKPVRDAPTDSEIRELPMAVVASQIGQFQKGNSWTLRFNSTGWSDLSVSDVPGNQIKQFTASIESLNRIRELLISDKFFLLEDEYGEPAPGGHTKTLSVTLGNKWRKEVRIHYLANGWLSTNQKLSDPVRALHSYNVIRSWFSSNAPNLADTLERDNEVMKQLIKNSKEKE